MSKNIKPKWFLLAPLLLAIFFAFGCASTKTIPYTPYTPVQGSEPWFAKTGPKVFIHEFDNEAAGEISHGFGKSVEVAKGVGESLLRYAFRPFMSRSIIPKNIIPSNPNIYRPICGTVGGINCSQLLTNAFTKEFQALGLQVVENVNEAQVIIKGKILRFDSLTTRAVNLDYKFKGKNHKINNPATIYGHMNLSLEFVAQNGNLLFQKKLGATGSRPVSKSGDGKEGLISETMHELFSQFYRDPVYPSYFPGDLRTVLKEVSNKPPTNIK